MEERAKRKSPKEEKKCFSFPASITGKELGLQRTVLQQRQELKITAH